MKSNNKYEVIIIGAGISGMAAGVHLKSRNISNLLLDKGKAPGGRLASKRIVYGNDKVTFDYGCRYLHGSSREFSSKLKEMASKKLLREWNINNQNSVINELDNRIKFIGRSSIRDIALEMSKELDTLNSVKVLKIRRNENSWEIYTDKNEIFYSSQLICTMPVPQIIELYKKSNLEIPSDIENNLTEVRYSRSIVGLLILEGKSVLKEEGGIEFSEGDIAFITDNNLKGVNNHGQALTIEMSDKFSRENWNLQDHELILKIIDSASDWLGSNVLQYQIHKWKYSRPLNSFPKKFEFIDHPGPVYLAGDAFMGNSAESAYLSGLSAAKCLLSGEKVKLNGAEV